MTTLLIDWDWADSNPDDPCVRDAQERSLEARVSQTDAEPLHDLSDPLALVNDDEAQWENMGYYLEADLTAYLAERRAADPLLVVITIRDEQIERTP